MLIRAWDINYSNKTYCSPIDWIDIDQQFGTANIIFSKVSSIFEMNIGFQAQIYTLNYLSLSDILTEFSITNIAFTNNNTQLINIDLDDYILYGSIKNFTASFVDDEGDNIYVKATSTSGVLIFASRTPSDTVFNILWEGIDNQTLTQSITVSYYDSYHKDPSYWSNITYLVNVFMSDPPTFSGALNNITISSWAKIEYVLPDAFDPNNDSFTISVIGENSYWSFIIHDNTVHKLVVDASLLGPILDKTVFNIKIKLEDSTNSFKVYNMNVTVIEFSTPYFYQIQNIFVFFPNIEQINYEIISNINLNILGLQVQANNWYNNLKIEWINQYIDSENNSILVKPSKANNGIYWVNLVAKFIWKSLIRYEIC